MTTKYYLLNVKGYGARKVEISAPTEAKCAEVARSLADSGHYQRDPQIHVHYNDPYSKVPEGYVEEIDRARFRRFE